MINKLRSRLDVTLVFIVILSAFLNAFNIWKDEYVNTYYTMTVGSMMESFHNFFFASLDSAGSVTVDKPPVTFWIQTLSAEIFGLHGWSVILPQALAGVGSVLLLYFLIKPSFGTTAARLSALAMATTPIAVAVSRTNNIDSMLVFTLLLATYFLFKGVKNNSTWSLIGAFAIIGIGFNMKMLQAYMVLPAFYLFYLLAAKTNWKKKAKVLASATAVLLAISLSWAVIVDSIPEDERPYIGSSDTNSVLELAFGYNGLSRLTGDQNGTPGDGGTSGNNTPTGLNAPEGASDQVIGNNGRTQQGPPSNQNGNQGGAVGGTVGDAAQATQGGQPGGSQGNMFGTGEEGPLRLFQSELSGQASWLLPFAILSSIGLLIGFRFRETTMKQIETIFWLAWLIPIGIFFSIAGFFHQYYLIMLAPPIAALFGTGGIQLFEYYRNESNWKSWLLPISIGLTSLFQWVIMKPYDEVIGVGWSLSVLILGVLFTLLLTILKYRKSPHTSAISITMLLILLIGPLYWATTPIVYGGNSALPEAGPNTEQSVGDGVAAQSHIQLDEPLQDSAQDNRSQMGSPGGMEDIEIDEKTLTYLRSENTSETYLFATTSYQVAAPYIIDEEEEVITTGGFSGTDPVYSVEEMKELISNGEVSFFLLSDQGGRGGSSELAEWITTNGEEIPEEEWNSTVSNDENTNSDPRGGSTKLYKLTASEGGNTNE
ncbi:glycosyltransferase family 39 protein [Alkalihalobacillus hwajinpoensis]|uniref:glycosyltransferase family 39 protein n=1 Tax=Guptibacillus hwajinpoensis TaxID=208199 RepID=UPI0018840BFA|nr:glycosyltransferase family 39 protein [Pseudalkalibacillus hwajinpoensis]MBF0705838.1 glycosyltransferase family 39 protein [Pseudalkalibacillus hwajinpoensis]